MSENGKDQLSTILRILSFLMPIVGAIIYFVNKNDHPAKAKSACHAALWGFGVGIVIQIIYTVTSGA
ncbi:hypothetical protein [Tamlana sp. I1]|uniref:hypothetical protein n=1 Tax=Tamlana sp. I1 TaxID=2762061 RepID=UPI00188F4572|nr:hypothetical protein [Tamlana sp. I1]